MFDFDFFVDVCVFVCFKCSLLFLLDGERRKRIQKKNENYDLGLMFKFSF